MQILWLSSKWVLMSDNFMNISNALSKCGFEGIQPHLRLRQARSRGKKRLMKNSNWNNIMSSQVMNLPLFKDFGLRLSIEYYSHSSGAPGNKFFPIFHKEQFPGATNLESWAYTMATMFSSSYKKLIWKMKSIANEHINIESQLVGVYDAQVELLRLKFSDVVKSKYLKSRTLGMCVLRRCILCYCDFSWTLFAQASKQLEHRCRFVAER